MGVGGVEGGCSCGGMDCVGWVRGEGWRGGAAREAGVGFSWGGLLGADFNMVGGEDRRTGLGGKKAGTICCVFLLCYFRHLGLLET